jgi:molybdopterin converting factor small subunit
MSMRLKTAFGKGQNSRYRKAMPVIKMPSPFLSYTQGLLEVQVEGRTVAAAMHDLVIQYPALLPHLFNSQGGLRPFVNLFLGEENIRDLQGLETPLEQGDVLRLVPSVAGG